MWRLNKFQVLVFKTLFTYKALFVFVLAFIVSFSFYWGKISDLFYSYGLPDVDLDGTLSYLWLQAHLHSTGKQPFVNDFVGFPFGFDYTYLPFKNHVFDLIISLSSYFDDKRKIVFSLFNINTLLMYPLCAAFAYLFYFELSGSVLGSAFASVSFAFSHDFLTMSRGVMPLGQLWLIPLVFLFSLRYFKNPFEPISLFFSAFCMGLLLGIDSYYAFYSIGFLGLLSFFCLFAGFVSPRHILFFVFVNIFFILFMNLEYIYSNFYLMSSAGSNSVGRKLEEGTSYLKWFHYFLPAKNSLLWSKFSPSGGGLFCVSCLSIFVGGLVRKNYEFGKKLVLLLFIFLAVIFSIKISGLDLINQLYSYMFPPFRSVARLSVFAVFFMCAFCSVTISEFTKKAHCVRFTSIGILLLCLFSFFENMTIDPTVWLTTDYRPVEAFYSQLKMKFSPKAVLGMPFSFPGFLPGFYHRMGQMTHESKLFNDLDPKSVFVTQSRPPAYNAADIVAFARSLGIDTIFFHVRLMQALGLGKLSDEFIHQDAVKLLGEVKSSVLPLSGLYSSLWIKVFRIGDLFENRGFSAEMNSAVKLNEFHYEFSFNPEKIVEDPQFIKIPHTSLFLTEESYSPYWIPFVCRPALDSALSKLHGSLVRNEFVNVLLFVGCKKAKIFAHDYKETSYKNRFVIDSKQILQTKKIHVIMSRGILRFVSNAFFWLITIGLMLFLFKKSSKVFNG